MSRFLFISYRREDTADVVGRMHDMLEVEFGPDAIFLDVDSIEIGDDFETTIQRHLFQSEVFLCVIGPTWLSIEDEKGKVRIHNEGDWVRREIEIALQNPDLRFVPLLVNGAAMPKPEELPASIRDLGKRQAHFVRRNPHFKQDMTHLVDFLQRGGEGVAGIAPRNVGVRGSRIQDGSANVWTSISESLDAQDYEEFVKLFPGTAERVFALRHRRLLEHWRDVDKTRVQDVEEFLALEPFSALRLKCEAALVKARAQAEATRLSKLGDDVIAARSAAEELRPTPERLFRLNISRAAHWPAIEMVALPRGSFRMGAPDDEVGCSDNDRPQRLVQIKEPLAMGRFPVTFHQWDAAVKAGAPLRTPEDNGWGREFRPVVNVSWDEVSDFLRWLNLMLGLSGQPDCYRLPTEAEWEYACRAGTTTPFYFGASISPDQANYNGEFSYANGPIGLFRGKTVPVGSLGRANEFGLHDMHGNVWEWCSDAWSHPIEDPRRRVRRGGAWLDPPVALRSAERSARPVIEASST